MVDGRTMSQTAPALAALLSIARLARAAASRLAAYPLLSQRRCTEPALSMPRRRTLAELLSRSPAPTQFAQTMSHQQHSEQSRRSRISLVEPAHAVPAVGFGTRSEGCEVSKPIARHTKPTACHSR